MAKPVLHYGKWRIRYVDHHGVRRSQVFDSKQEASEALIENRYRRLQVKRNGGRGLIEGKTGHDVCDYWIQNKVPLKRSGYEDKSIIENHLRPSFGRLKLTLITVQEIDQYKTLKLSTLHPKTLHNHLTLLISMMNLAKELNWVEAVPKIKKPKCSILDSEYSYLKNNNEVKSFLSSALSFGENVHMLYATALYTGMREGELAGLCTLM